MRKLGVVVCLFLFASACSGTSETVKTVTTTIPTTTLATTTTAAPTTTLTPTTTVLPTTTVAPSTIATATATATTASTTTTTAAPTTIAAPATTTAPTTTEAPEELAAVCMFDDSVPKISCQAVGATQGSHLRWESNVYGWNTGTFYEVELLEQHQLVPEVVVNLQECQGSDCESVTTTIDTSVIAQTPTTTAAPATTTAAPTTQAPAITVPGATELVVICSFDEPLRRLSCESGGGSGGSLKWTNNIDSESSGGETYWRTFEWGEFIDQIQVQLEECNGSGCSVASWSTTVALQPKGDCPDDFTGWFKTFPLEDYTQILEVGPPGRLVSVSDFKGHGYFRVADWQNVINVRLPIDGTLYAGSKTHFAGRDAAWDPELNYGLRFRTPCEGLSFRFGHIIQLTPSVATLFDEFSAQENTETLWFDEPLEMSEGDVIGTAIGFPLTGNAFLDFGVYDDFKRVRTAQDPRFYNAACYYEFFSPMLANYLSSRITRVDNLEPGLCP